MPQRKNRKAKTASKSKHFSFVGLDGKTYSLTPLQKRWADAYVGDAYLDLADASYLAGYVLKNRDTARSIGSENLRKPPVRSYIDKKLDDAGYNDTVADLELLAAIKQRLQWGAKVSAIREYNEVRGRHAPKEVRGEIVVVEKGWRVEKGDRDKD